MTQAGPTRRTFLGAAVAVAALDARTYARVRGANDRVTMGLVGCGGRGRFVAQQLLDQGADFAILCDPDPAQVGKARALLPVAAAADKDFRRVLDRGDVDAVLIAVPDHWHALPFVSAVQAGKDVYVEKPTAYTVAESRAMVEAAKKSRSVVQIGTQQKSAAHYRRAVEQIRNGDLDRVSRVRFWNV
jgi:predicted dehydrogenase